MRGHFSRRNPVTTAAVALLLALLAAGRACGQGPTIGEGGLPSPGSGASMLGPSPGTVESLFQNQPGSDQPTLGGGTGTIVPRVPPSITQPPAPRGILQPSGITPAPSLPAAELPLYGLLDLPPGGEEPAPAGGITLDEAIERLIAANLDLRAKFYEIPQADADILTASLRANPIFYADAQLVPYGNYTRERPGGQTQYDVNVSIPLDVSGKRRARMTAAGHARRVIEAQYQNAVRLEIDNLYTAYVDLLAARETVRFARTSVEGLNQILEPIQRRFERKLITEADVNRVKIQRDFALIGLTDAEETYRKSQHTLAALLNLPPAESESLQLQGPLRERSAPPPQGQALIALALESRPDLAAYRLGIQRAAAEVRLAEANRMADVYWLVQPYTFQDNTPLGLKSPHSWAMGITVPLPISNRNQGNIRRARLNVAQTQTELAALERAIVTEVRNAERDYLVTKAAVERVETQLIPAARQVLETVRLRYEKGETDVVAYLNGRRDFNDVVRQYRDLLVQHRRSMLKLNTAAGRRVLP
jgi:cobalt-zinc-cadmium efflux system outer membrane protein